MTRRRAPVVPWLVFLLLPGCSLTAHQALRYTVLPEQITLAIREPEALPSSPVPELPPPRTVADLRPQTQEWRLSLDEAIRIALENAKVVRVLAGVTAVSSGRTIYDTAIANATIDQLQAVFDPNAFWRNTVSRTETPFGQFDPLNPGAVQIAGTQVDEYRTAFGLTKTNVLGGQWSLTDSQNVSRVNNLGPFDLLALNPQNRSAFELSYTQPFLQGGGFAVNLAPIVIARIDTERSFFQYKDSVQELVRGVIEGYWALVQARVDLFARQIQVDLSKEQADRAEARFKTRIGDLAEAAQARTSYLQFQAALVAAKANLLNREGALRNLLFLPPEDNRQIVPVSAPASARLPQNWEEIVRLAEQRRPDLIELKLVLEADQVRLVQAENFALPRLDASTLYRWNGLYGTMPNGERIESDSGQFTDWSIGVNFSVPLGLRDGRARVRQTKLIIARDVANIEQQNHAIVSQLALTLRDLDNAYEQYLVFRRAREAADINLKAQIARFRARADTLYITVLQALNDWGNTVSSEAGALLSYNTLLAQLERQTGTILETHGLVFNEERYRFAGPLGHCGHGRLYPSAVPITGAPTRYPGGDQPADKGLTGDKPDLRLTPLPKPEKLPVLPEVEKKGP